MRSQRSSPGLSLFRNTIAQADFESAERDLSFGVRRERLTRDRAVRCLQESGATLLTATGAQEDRSLGSAADAGLALVDRALMW